MKHLNKYITLSVFIGILAFIFLAIAQANNPLRNQLNAIQEEYEQQQIDITAACKRIGRKSAQGFATGDFTEFNDSNNWFSSTYAVNAKDTCISINQQDIDIVIHHTAVETPEQLAVIDKKHAELGYDLSCKGHTTGYHLFIGTDGTLVQTRCLYERPLHSKGTIDHKISEHSISIVMAGNFEEREPTDKQLEVLEALILKLQQNFTGEVLTHQMTSATKCAGKYLNAWVEEHYPRQNIEYGAEPVVTNEEREHIAKSLAKGELLEPDIIKYYRTYHEELTLQPLASFDILFSRYYTPTPDQESYFRDTYEEDFAVNCHGDCFSTANSTKIDDSMAGKVLACPPEFPFGTRIYIEDFGIATCKDRGGMIKGGRLDLWAGASTAGLNRIRNNEGPTGLQRITILSL